MIWPFRRRDREPIGDPFAVDLEVAFTNRDAHAIITNTIWGSDTRDAHEVAANALDNLLAAGYSLTTDGAGPDTTLAREILAENLRLHRDFEATSKLNTELTDELREAQKLQGDLTNANARVTELELSVAALVNSGVQPADAVRHYLGYRPANQFSDMEQVQTLRCGEPRSVCLRETARANQLAADLQALTERQPTR